MRISLNTVGTTGTLSWTAPAGGGTVTVGVSPVGPKATVANGSATITGLVSGTTYTFTVTVTGGAPVNYTAVAIGAPTAVAVQLATTTSAVFSYTAPTGVTKFAVQQLIGGVWTNVTSTSVISGTAGTTTATGLSLPIGAIYSFRVASLNASSVVGSVSATVTIDLKAAPAAATNPVAVGGIANSGSVTLSWTSGNNDSSAIVYRSTQTITKVGTINRIGWTTPAVIATIAAGNLNTYKDTGLPKGTVYSYQVVLQNAVGSSAVTAAFPANGVTAP